MGPVTAPDGTVAVMLVALLMVNEALTPLLNFTADVPVKFVPVIVTVRPTMPLVELMPDTVAQVITVKILVGTSAQFEFAFVREIRPVTAPLGTVAVMLVSLLTVNCADRLLANLTAVTPVKPVTVIVTVEVTMPLAGLMLATVGQEKACVGKARIIKLPAAPASSISL